MIRSINELRHYDIAARDGHLGDVRDVFFDDHRWKVRYLVLDTGNWLPGRRVLVSPEAIERIDAVAKAAALSLTKQAIRESPEVSAHKPVSRQNEIALANHFSWPRYWEEYPSGAGMMPFIPRLEYASMGSDPRQVDDDDDLPHGDPNLRSAREVEGYRVAAKDGDIGHVEDFLVDDADWRLRFLVVDTRNWLPGRRVLVSPAWVRGIDWADERIYVEAERDTIESAPVYEPGKEIDQALEKRIFRHYGRKPPRG